jgi:hypothetical protein
MLTVGPADSAGPGHVEVQRHGKLARGWDSRGRADVPRGIGGCSKLALTAAQDDVP